MTTVTASPLYLMIKHGMYSVFYVFDRVSVSCWSGTSYSATCSRRHSVHERSRLSLKNRNMHFGARRSAVTVFTFVVGRRWGTTAWWGRGHRPVPVDPSRRAVRVILEQASEWVSVRLSCFYRRLRARSASHSFERVALHGQMRRRRASLSPPGIRASL